MAWVEVCISVSGQDADLAEDALEELGALAVTLQDDADDPVLEPGPGETPLWPTVQLRGLFEAETGRVRVEVTSAKPLSDAYYARLTEKLQRVTDRQVVLVRKQDPSLIGGVVTRVGDQVFDGSLSNRLSELKETLLADGDTL